MGVEPADLEPGRLAALHRRRQGRERDPELRVLLAGGDLLVGVRTDPGGDPQQNPLAAPGCEPFEPLDLVERVDDDVADPGLERGEELGLGLVVAVHVDPRRVEARAERQVQLAAGGDVAGEPLLGEQAVGGGAAE